MRASGETPDQLWLVIICVIYRVVAVILPSPSFASLLPQQVVARLLGSAARRLSRVISSLLDLRGSRVISTADRMMGDIEIKARFDPSTI